MIIRSQIKVTVVVVVHCRFVVAVAGYYSWLWLLFTVVGYDCCFLLVIVDGYRSGLLFWVIVVVVVDSYALMQ